MVSQTCLFPEWCVESCRSLYFAVTTAVAALEAAVASVPEEKRPVRIIGSSLGAYVAAVYAAKPENQAGRWRSPSVGKFDRSV